VSPPIHVIHVCDRTEAVTQFNLHLVSDSTGETLNAVARAAITQFDDAEPIEHMWSLVRTRKQVEKVVEAIDAQPGLVMFTLVRRDVRDVLETGCRRLGVPCIAVLDPVLTTIGGYLGAKSIGRPGMQHSMDAEYFERISAMDYCLAHDDGQSQMGLTDADVVLVGVSRTSKTPTCFYLANRGVRAANVPFVTGQPLPSELAAPGGPLVIALTASPERLVQIRRNRLLHLSEAGDSSYADLEVVRTEVTEARRLFAAHGWLVIDVTRRSIEETAARILTYCVQRTKL
jgi:regulator of PEP synthase PpsR (kinase-PPPase family)